MPDQTDTDPYATLERVTIATDGGTGRGATKVVYMTPDTRRDLWEWANENRAL